MIYVLHSNSLHVTKKNLFSTTNHEDILNYGKADTCNYIISLIFPCMGVYGKYWEMWLV